MGDEPINWMAVMGTRRTVRRGPLVEVGGLASLDDDGNVIHRGDAYAQTQRTLERIVAEVEAQGGDVSSIVRTRIFVAPGAEWQGIARAHGERFSQARPVTTMVYSELMDPGFLVEIDATAWIE